MLYYVTMTPLEAYTLGTDIGFAMKGETPLGKTSYYMTSNEMPDQTTLLGMLRYLTLDQHQLLKTDFSYTAAEYAQMNARIGAESFSFASDTSQSFGDIHSISPVFLVDSKGEYYVKNPFHNNTKQTVRIGDTETHQAGYTPMVLEESLLCANGIPVHLPAQGEYQAKNGHASGYYNLASGEIFPAGELFQSNVLTGNCKNGKVSNDDAGFYKRETKKLADGFSFAAFVEAEQLPAHAIASMGYRKAAVAVRATPVQQNDLVEKVQAAFAKTTQETTWQYALSDIVLAQPFAPTDFSIIEKKQMRNLETTQEGSAGRQKIKKSAVQYNLIESGSVFYQTQSLPCKETCSHIGYNTIVTIGG